MEVPAKKQRKSVYVGLVEEAVKSGKTKKAPSTAPSKRAASSRKSTRKSASASPRARRKLMDMPKPGRLYHDFWYCIDVLNFLYPNAEADEDEDEEEEEVEGPVVNSGSRVRACIIAILTLATIAAYVYWVYQQVNLEASGESSPLRDSAAAAATAAKTAAKSAAKAASKAVGGGGDRPL